MRVLIVPVVDYEPPGWYAHVLARDGAFLWTTETKPDPWAAIRSARLWVQANLPKGTDCTERKWWS